MTPDTLRQACLQGLLHQRDFVLARLAAQRLEHLRAVPGLEQKPRLLLVALRQAEHCLDLDQAPEGEEALRPWLARLPPEALVQLTLALPPGGSTSAEARNSLPNQ